MRYLQVSERVARVRQRIAGVGGDPAGVRLVAVTKGFGPEAVEAAMAAGIFDLGESYAQELSAKAARLTDALAGGAERPRWHFIGQLQSNKVKGLAPLVGLWQSIDRLRLVEELVAQVAGGRVLVQVNVGGAGGGGCRPDEAPMLVDRLGQGGCVVEGLMAVGAPGPPENARAGFRRLASLGAQLGLVELSMGMSDDLEVAVQEGATMVRVGRAIFGPRAPRDRWPTRPSATAVHALTSRPQEDV